MACRDGDHDACARIVRAYQDVALRTAFLMTSDTSAAEDIAQNALRRFDPSRPTACTEVDQPVTLRVTIVDAETRTPLPDGVEIEGSLPETMDGSIFRDGVSSRTLNRVGHGEYVATFEFWSSGTWTVQVDFPGDGMRSGSVRVGVVEVR